MARPGRSAEVSYLDFLSHWYNLVFLTIGLAGLLCAAWGRLSGRDLFGLSAGLLASAVIGLTWNGAIHDLGLGSPAVRFPLILIVSTAAGALVARLLRGLRDRHFRRVTAVRFNRPGLEGARARIVTRDAGPAPGSGRAQWQDADGVLQIVHVHTAGETLGFGCRILLGPFDIESESYLALPEKPRRE